MTREARLSRRLKASECDAPSREAPLEEERFIVVVGHRESKL